MLEQRLKDNKFTLVVSLPKNDLGFARAAIEAGADAIKVHINAFHFASNQKYGSFDEEKPFLEEVAKLAKETNTILGIVPGDGENFANQDDFDKLHELGFDFISTYIEHAPVSLVSNKQFDICAAISSTTKSVLEGLNQIDVDIIEASIMDHSNYRGTLDISDIASYAKIAHNTDKPVLIPTQKNVKPSEVKALYDAGCKAIMLGAVVFENDSLDHFTDVVKSYKTVIDSL